MSADDALRQAIEETINPAPARPPVPLPAKLYDSIKALGWDIRGYVRQKPAPKKDQA